jgi:hypothetical protein
VGLKSDIIVVQSSALQTTSGNSGAIDVGGYEAGGLILNITAKTGTFTDYRFFLQASPDNTNWYGAASGTGLVVGSITGGAVDIPTGAYWFGVSNYIGPWVRLAWTLAGGTNVTFSCIAAFRRGGGIHGQ